MEKQLHDAIKSRIDLNYSKDKIVDEFVSLGYTEEAASAFYDEVAGDSGSSPVSSIPDTPQVSEPEIQETAQDNIVVEEESLSEPHKHKFNFVPVLLVVVAVFLLGGVAFAAMTFSPNLLKGIFSSAPYQTEADLLIGLGELGDTLTAYEFSGYYNIYLEEAEETTQVINSNNEYFLTNINSYQEEVLPNEGHLKATFEGKLDSRDENNVKFDVDLSVGVLMEPVAMGIGGQFRGVDGSYYGKLTDLPELLEMQLPVSFPLDTWVLLFTETDLEMFSDPEALLQMSSLEFMPEVNTDSAISLLDKTESNFASVASAMEPSFEMNEEARALLKEYPLLTFKTEPEKIKQGEEVLYKYVVNLNPENFPKYAEFAKEYDADLYTEEQMEMMVSEEYTTYLSEVSELLDVIIFVREDGTLHTLAIEEKIKVEESADWQMRFEFRVTFGRQDDNILIEAPDGVHDKSVKDMFMESLMDAQMGGMRASVMQSIANIRLQAELFYNNNNFTYSGVCNDTNVMMLIDSVRMMVPVEYQIDAVSDDLNITCNDTANSYAVISPLPDMTSAWCVDSTGFAGETSFDALNSVSDTTCQ